MFRNNILKMEEYKPPLEGRTGYLLLDFNERTIPPPRRIRRLLEDYSKTGKLNTYPEYGDLDENIGTYAGVKKRQVIFTNGSDQGIDIVFRATVDKSEQVIIPSPSFGMYYQAASIQDATITRARYKDETLAFPLEEILSAISEDTRLVVISNPNNPTGTVASKKEVEKIVDKAKEFNTAVLIDEAYHEFNPNVSARELIDSYNNLFVLRTFSKALGVAALRAGYVLSQEENISQLRKIRGPYDCNMDAVAVARSLKFKDTIREMNDYIKEVMELAKPRTEEFLRNRGMKVYPSGANFLLVDPTPFSSEEIYNYLRSYTTGEYRGILVRPRSDPQNTFRLSVGTNENMNVFMKAITDFLKTSSCDPK